MLNLYELKSVKERFVKAFLDGIVLLLLYEKGPLTGYKLIELIYERFKILIGPSSLYPLLHKLETNGLIAKMASSSRRKGGQLTITDEGKVFLLKMMDAFERIFDEWRILKVRSEKALRRIY